jgi:hypothetical protein
LTGTLGSVACRFGGSAIRSVNCAACRFCAMPCRTSPVVLHAAPPPSSPSGGWGIAVGERCGPMREMPAFAGMTERGVAELCFSSIGRHLSHPCSPAKAGAQSGSPPSRGNMVWFGILALSGRATTPAEAGAQLRDGDEERRAPLPRPSQLGPGLRRGGACGGGRWQAAVTGSRLRSSSPAVALP